MQHFHFPFGQPLKPVKQSDIGPKKAFVLGVYASAVHARWIDNKGKQKVTALAVASEPNIFWTGENAEEIIHAIPIPPELGRLVAPSNKSFNGPSGKVLDELYLHPLGLNRGTTWLCDLLPESRVNPSQREAINKHYTPIAAHYNLPNATIPDFNQSEVDSMTRRSQILEELVASKADTIILLGDLPIKHFLRHVSDIKKAKLSQFTPYGKPLIATIKEKKYTIYALCHPRQAGKLGMSNAEWCSKHQEWTQTVPPIV